MIALVFFLPDRGLAEVEGVADVTGVAEEEDVCGVPLPVPVAVGVADAPNVIGSTGCFSFAEELRLDTDGSVLACRNLEGCGVSMVA